MKQTDEREEMEKKEEAQEGPKNPGKTGFVLRLVYAILFTVPAVALILVALINWEYLRYLLITGSLSLVVSAVQYTAAFMGRRSKAANIVSIVLGAFGIFNLVGLLGILGGVYGNRALKAQAEGVQQPEEVSQSDAAVREEVSYDGTGDRFSDGKDGNYLDSKGDQFSDGKAEDGVFVARKISEEKIVSKTSDVAKKRIMIVLIVSYALFLIAGILLAAIPQMGVIISGIGICPEEANRAYGIAIGTMFVALTPSIGYYFATLAPVSLGKKGKIALTAVTTFLLVAMVAIFFLVINFVEIGIGVTQVTEDGLPISQYVSVPVVRFFEGSDSWFMPLSMVFAALAIGICYALLLFHLDPEKIHSVKPEQEGEGIFAMLKYWLAMLGYGVMCFVKWFMRKKEEGPDVYILIVSLLLTWLVYFASFVFFIILIVAFVLVLALVFTGMVKFAEEGTSSGGGERYVITENGCEKELTYNPYLGIYEDAAGVQYVSNDGGQTVHRKE